MNCMKLKIEMYVANLRNTIIVLRCFTHAVFAVYSKVTVLIVTNI